MIRIGVILVLLAGCDVVFRLDDLRAPSDGGIPGDTIRDTGAAIDAPPNCLADMFTGSDIQGHWSVINELQAFTVVQNNNALEITLPKSFDSNAEGALQTFRKYNFTGAFVQVEVPVVTTGTTYNAENYLAVRIDNENSYVIRVANGGIDFWTRRSGVLSDHGGRPYDATQHRWWRIEHAAMANEIRFSTSNNAQAWFVQGIGSVSVPLDRIEVSLRAGNLAPGDANPGRAVFDNFLMCPAVIVQ